jgi:hypothetical protein
MLDGVIHAPCGETEDIVGNFYPSLYLNMGQSYELLGDMDQANQYYKKASDLGVDHDSG